MSKKVYRSPSLTNLGSVEDITLGKLSQRRPARRRRRNKRRMMNSGS